MDTCISWITVTNWQVCGLDYVMAFEEAQTASVSFLFEQNSSKSDWCSEYVDLINVKLRQIHVYMYIRTCWAECNSTINVGIHSLIKWAICVLIRVECIAWDNYKTVRIENLEVETKLANIGLHYAQYMCFVFNTVLGPVKYINYKHQRFLMQIIKNGFILEICVLI